MSSSKAELIARRKAVMPHLRLFYDPEPVSECGEREREKESATSKNVLHTQKTYIATKVHLVKGEGVWLTDSEGVKHLDLYNNVASLGHCHPRVVEALTNQVSDSTRSRKPGKKVHTVFFFFLLLLFQGTNVEYAYSIPFQYCCGVGGTLDREHRRAREALSGAVCEFWQ